MGDRVHLTDFGLAKDLATGSRYTRTGQALGTPAYMSPEAVRGETGALAPATDVWSLGCVLYELLAGRRAFAAASDAQVVAAVLTGEPTRLGSLRPDLPRDLHTVLAVALSKRAAHRHPVAAVLRDDLDRLLRGARPALRPRRRHPLAVAVAAAALLAAAGAVVSGWGGTPMPGRAPATGELPAPGAAAAERGWALRFDAPERAAALLGDACAAAPHRHEWRVRLGLLCWSADRNAEARAAWEAIPATAAEWSRARLYLGLEAYCRETDRERASDDARVFLEPIADAPGPVGTVASALRRLFDRDVEGARAALDGHPGWEAAAIRGQIAMVNSQDPRRAIVEFDLAAADGWRFAWLLNNRGVARTAVGDPAGAIVDLDASLARRPRYATALVNRAIAHDATGDVARALADYAAALEIAPDCYPAHLNRGTMRERRGDLAGARADLDAALRLRPQDAVARHSRAKVRAHLGDPAGALTDLDVALAARPDDIPYRLARGALRFQMGDLAGAREDADAVLRLDPGDSDGLDQRARVCVESGELAAALRDFEAAVAAAPTRARIRAGRAMARALAGDLAGAEADAAAVLAVDPSSRDALATMAELRDRAGDLEGKLAFLDRRIALEATDAEARHERGLVLGRLGRWTEALADHEAAAARRPHVVKIVGALADARLACEDVAGAIAAFRQALALDPTARLAEHFRRRLAECEAQPRRGGAAPGR